MFIVYWQDLVSKSTNTNKLARGNKYAEIHWKLNLVGIWDDWVTGDLLLCSAPCQRFWRLSSTSIYRITSSQTTWCKPNSSCLLKEWVHNYTLVRNWYFCQQKPHKWSDHWSSVLLDMSAAFNSVDARIKIPKLQQLGLVEIATKLIKSYMTGIENVTKQYVSKPVAMHTGIGLGSV